MGSAERRRVFRLALALVELLIVGVVAASGTEFELSCGSTVVEGGVVNCTLSNEGENGEAWPGVVIFHKASDADRALVRGRKDVEFGALVPSTTVSGALWWVGDTLIGYSRIDWAGKAGAGASRTVPVRTLDDGAFEGEERFYVTLTPDWSRDVTRLNEDSTALAIRIQDNDSAATDASPGRVGGSRPGVERPACRDSGR